MSDAAPEARIPSNCTLYIACAAQKDDEQTGFYSLTLGPAGNVIVLAGPDWLKSKPLLVGRISPEQRASVFRAALKALNSFDFIGGAAHGGNYVELSFTAPGSSLSAKAPRLKRMNDAAPGMAGLLKLLDEILPANARTPIDDGTFTNPRWSEAAPAATKDSAVNVGERDAPATVKPPAAAMRQAEAENSTERLPTKWSVHFDCSCRDGSRRAGYYNLDLDQTGKGKVAAGSGDNNSTTVFDDRLTQEQAQAVFRAAGAALRRCSLNAGGGQVGCQISLSLSVAGGPKLTADIHGTVFSEVGPDFRKFLNVLDKKLPKSAAFGKYLHH